MSKALSLVTGWTFLLVACQTGPPDATPAADSPAAATGPAVGTVEWKIQTYSSAAPASIAANATVLDWNDSLKAPGTELRKGTNGWTCMPTVAPPAGGFTTAIQTGAMCADEMSLAWAQGYLSKTKPQNRTLGIAYMLHGDLGASNTDPFATDSTADNDWVASGPHIMVFPADANRIRDIPTDHRSGGPYQMWKGTPYAHIMIPTGPAGMQH